MDVKPMKILIVEDDIEDCNKLIECAKQRDDIEIVAITDSDTKALQDVKIKYPDGIILDLELNNSQNGSVDTLDFVPRLNKMNLNFEPIVIVTTHVNSKRTYDILHRSGVDLILYKDHPNYSANHVFNKFISLRKETKSLDKLSVEETLKYEENVISDLIDQELNLVGITNNLKGRQYIHDAIKYIMEHEKDSENVIQYLSKIHKRSSSTITNGIQNAIIHGWRVTAVEDLEKHYATTVNYQTGIPTPMELIYYYVKKIKKMI